MNAGFPLKRMVGWGVAAMVTGLAQACAGTAAAGGATIEPMAPGQVTIDIANDMSYAARVRARYVGGEYYPMGTVDAFKTIDSASIPWNPSPLVFEVHVIIGPGSYFTEEILVEPGESLELRLPANIQASSFFRRIGQPRPDGS